MNEICVENCAPKRDTSAFELKPNLGLLDMPRFPDTKDMSREEKFTSVTIYLAKAIDHIQSNEEIPGFPIHTKPSYAARAKAMTAIGQIAKALQTAPDEKGAIKKVERVEETVEVAPHPLASSDGITRKENE